MTVRDRWTTVGCLVSLGAAVVVFFWDAILLRGAFFVQDVMVQNYPFREFVARGLKELVLPLWEPAINCGFPLFAEGQAGPLYPFNLVTAFLLPTYAALTYNVVFHLWIAGVATYGLLRVLGCCQAAALTGGMTYALSGYIVVRCMSQNFVDAGAWLPVLFLLVELALRQRRLLYLWAGAGVVALQFLAGHPQATAYGVVAALLYGVARLAAAGAGARGVCLLIVTPLVGAGLAAVQLLPTAELVTLSGRGGGMGFEQFVSMSLPPERFITLLLPNFFGNSGTGSYWGQEAGFFIQLCPYLGVLGLFLAITAVRERRDLVTALFVCLAAGGLLLSLGRFTGFFELLHGTPGLSLFRIPTRFLLWWSLGGAALVGLGLDRLLSSGSPREERARWRSCLVLAAAAGAMVWLNRQVLTGDAVPGLQEDLYRGDLIEDLVRAGVLLLVAALLSTAWRWKSGRRLVSALVPLIVFADLFSFGSGFNALVESEVYGRTPATARTIASHAAGRAAALGGDPLVRSPGGVSTLGYVRCASLVSERTSSYDWHAGWMRNRSAYRAYPATLRMYTAGLFGIGNVLPGWSPLHLRHHWELMRGYPRLLPMANTGYVVSDRDLAWPNLELLRPGEIRVYGIRDVLPRAYVVPGRTVVADPAARLAYMRSPRFRPRAEVVLSRAPDPVHGSGSRPRAQIADQVPTAQITRYERHRVEVALGEHDGGYLVLSDTHYPGWEAYVDGQPRAILEANHVFRAVPVRPQERHAEFVYRPASFTIGKWVSIACLALWLVVAARAWRQELPLGRPTAVTGRAVLAKALQAALIVILYAAIQQWPLWASSLERCRFPSVLGP